MTVGIFIRMDEAQSEHTANGPIELLVIEDNEHYAAALRNNLEIEGFVVDVAHDGVLGMLRIRQRVPKLVILDVMLPGRDGYDVLRSLRDEGIQVPVVLLTPPARTRRTSCAASGSAQTTTSPSR